MNSRLCISIGLATAALSASAFAVDYPEERGVIPSVVPPAPDETGTVHNVPQWRGASAPSVSDYFARYDVNRDGVVSWAEAQADADLVQVFQRSDVNRDGVLTFAEFHNAAIFANQRGYMPRNPRG